MTVQVMPNGARERIMDNGQVTYNYLMSPSEAFWVVGSTRQTNLVSSPGTFSNLTVNLTTGPDSTPSDRQYVMYANRNGTTSSISTTVIGTSTTGSSGGSVMTVTRGDLVGLESFPGNPITGTDLPINSPGVSWAIEFTPDNAGDNLYSAYQLAVTDNPSSTKYYPPIGRLSANASATTDDARLVAPCSGTIKNLVGRLTSTTAIDSLYSYAVTFTLNGTEQALSITLDSGNLVVFDTSNSFTVQTGDTFAVKEVVSSGTSSISVSMALGYTFNAGTPGEYPIWGQYRVPGFSWRVSIGGYHDGETSVLNNYKVQSLSGDFYCKRMYSYKNLDTSSERCRLHDLVIDSTSNAGAGYLHSIPKDTSYAYIEVGTQLSNALIHATLVSSAGLSTAADMGSIALLAYPDSTFAGSSAPPVLTLNDSFGAPVTITDTSTTYTVRNGCATKESGEPSQHAGASSFRSLWWQWSPESGSATVTGSGNYNKLLAVYTGATVSSLSEVATASAGTGDSAVLTWSASTGTTYLVVAACSANNAGVLTLSNALTPDTPPPDPPAGGSWALFGGQPFTTDTSVDDAVIATTFSEQVVSTCPKTPSCP